MLGPSDRFYLVAVLVAVLVVAAGCSAVSSAPREDAGDDVLASSRSAGDGLDPEELPPGVTERGLANASALTEANVASLVESGYDGRLQIGASVRTPEGTRNFTLLQRERVRAGATAFSFYAERERGGQRERVTVWSNGSTTLGRSEQAGDVRYRQVPRERVTSQLAARELLAAYLGAGNYSVSEVERGEDRTLLSLEADRYAGPTGSQLPARENVTEYRSTVVVDPEGRIHFAELYLVSERGDSALTFALRFDLVELGAVRVDRPPWVEEGLAEAETTGGPTLAPGGTGGP